MKCGIVVIIGIWNGIGIVVWMTRRQQCLLFSDSSLLPVQCVCSWCELGFGMRARAVLQFVKGPLWCKCIHVLVGSVAVDASVLSSHFSPHYSRHFQTSCIVVCKKLNSSVKECDIFLCIEWVSQRDLQRASSKRGFKFYFMILSWRWCGHSIYNMGHDGWWTNNQD